jgi:hypothetical protein
MAGGTENNCTNICTTLAKLTLTNGKLPTHYELLAQLAFMKDEPGEAELEEGLLLGTLQELRQRRACRTCQLVLAAIHESADEGPQSPAADHQVRLLLFPGEQSFRLSYPSRLGTRLAFVADNDSQISAPDSARVIEGGEINPAKVQSWLRKCEDHHGPICYPQLDDKPASSPHDTLPAVLRIRRYEFNERATSNFRVIDLELECIVPQALDVRYVALSYVWGQLPMFRLLKSNLVELSRVGGLRGILGDLPRTILDAMEFVKPLSVRFLWIDALCLVQDDENDMEIGIEVMNSVYSGSYFTIIAASGTDATAGLPGVRPGSRSPSQSLLNLDPSGNGLRMTVQHSIDWHLKRSVYNQRGWTLQELVLPRRTVIFVNNQVYFRCQKANWAEETTADAFENCLDPDDGNISRIPDALNGGGIQSWWAYQKLLEEYSGRQIRFDGDALRATAGLLRPLCAGMETRMLEGLPGHYLDNAVLFISSRGDLRRRPGFASFSWAGWSGPVMWPRENYVWYDDAGRRTWDASNLFRWFAGKTFINWSYISVNGQQSQLMHDPYNAPSRLGLLMASFTRNYPQLRERLGGFQAASLSRFPSRYCTGSGSGPFYENWGLDRKEKVWSHATFDLANSQAEYDRLVRNIDPSKHRTEYLTLFNWMASRYCQVRRDGQQGTESRDELAKETPRSIGRFHDRVHYRFRSDDDLSRPRDDKRKVNAERSSAKTKDQGLPIP